MGQKLQIIAILWLVAACLISGGAAQDGGDVSPATDVTPTDDPTASEPTIIPDNPTTPEGNDSQPTGDPANTTTPGGNDSQPTGDPANTTPPVQPATTTPSTEKPPNPCDKKPCGRGSTCAPRGGEDFVCLCLVGDLYNEESKACEPAEVFPGELNMPGIEYKPEMSDTTSAAFQSAAKKIEDGLKDVFKSNAAFSGATVVKIEPSSQTGKVWFRSEAMVKATVGIVFKPGSDATTESIQNTMKDAAKDPNSPLSGTNFETVDQCKLNPCDTDSMTCKKAAESFACECIEGYVPASLSDRLCLACPSGWKADSNKCIKCPYGYAGFNCNDSSQLVLVIVGSVLGALLLTTLILLPVVALKSSKKSSKKSKKAKNEDTFIPQPSAKAQLVNSNSNFGNSNFGNSHAAPANRPANGFANAGVPKIPRATTNSSWDRGASLEMTQSNSRQNLVTPSRNTRQYEDIDDMPPYSQSRPQNSYAQARPQTNPYAQNRAQTNPYASSQGHSNPYFSNDDGRRGY